MQELILNDHDLSTSTRIPGKNTYCLNLVNLSGFEIKILKAKPITPNITIVTNKIPSNIPYNGTGSIGVEVGYSIGQNDFEIELEANIDNRNVIYIFSVNGDGFTLKEKLINT